MRVRAKRGAERAPIERGDEVKGRTRVLVALADLAVEALGRLLDPGIHDDQGVGGQIIEQRRRLLEEERQVILDAGRGRPWLMFRYNEGAITVYCVFHT